MADLDFIYELLQRLLIINFLRYFLIAGPVFFIFYVLYRQKWQFKRIQFKFPKRSDYSREVMYSIITILVFVGVALIAFASPLRQFNLAYTEISTRGWLWWFASIFLMIVLHDTYFYWTHRAMHHPSLYNIFHVVHHKSTNPSPWASYSFHPTEAVVQASIIFPIAYLIPFHPTALMVFLLFMMSYNVYGHLGYEILPKRFHLNPIGKWINTSVTHNMHHEYFRGNYGLYFLFWDRLMGTLHPDYDKHYAELDIKRS